MVGADRRLQVTLPFVVSVMCLEPSLLVHWFFFLVLAFFNIETVQSIRGDFAGWFLLLFGVIYFVWGVRWVIRKKQLKQNAEEVESQASTFSRCTPFALSFFYSGSL